MMTTKNDTAKTYCCSLWVDLISRSGVFRRVLSHFRASKSVANATSTILAMSFIWHWIHWRQESLSLKYVLQNYNKVVLWHRPLWYTMPHIHIALMEEFSRNFFLVIMCWIWWTLPLMTLYTHCSCRCQGVGRTGGPSLAVSWRSRWFRSGKSHVSAVSSHWLC